MTLGMRLDTERIIVSLLIPIWMEGLEARFQHTSYHSNKVQHFVQSFSLVAISFTVLASNVSNFCYNWLHLYSFFFSRLFPVHAPGACEVWKDWW